MYTVYKTTNLINNRFYIGVHKTDDPNDRYLGSGTAVNAAIRNFGRTAFSKVVLFTYPLKTPAYEKEQELITAEILNPLCYNLHEGGHGGFEYINKLPGKRARQSEVGKRNKGKKYHPMSQEGRANIAVAQQARFKRDGARCGWEHSEETKRLISEKALTRVVAEETKDMLRSICKGRKWYNDGAVSRRFYETTVPAEFTQGRLKTADSARGEVF